MQDDLQKGNQKGTRKEFQKESPRENWLCEFKQFMEETPVDPPRVLSEEVISTVHQALHPAIPLVIVKMSVATFAAGLVTLLFCPQFGLGIHDPFGYMDFFMQFGPYSCQAVCGFMFVGVGVAASVAVLRPEELRMIRRSRLLASAAVSALSLGVFVCAGATVLSTFGAVWFLGALAGSLITFELSFAARFRFAYNPV